MYYPFIYFGFMVNQLIMILFVNQHGLSAMQSFNPKAALGWGLGVWSNLATAQEIGLLTQSHETALKLFDFCTLY